MEGTREFVKFVLTLPISMQVCTGGHVQKEVERETRQEELTFKIEPLPLVVGKHNAVGSVKQIRRKHPPACISTQTQAKYEL